MQAEITTPEVDRDVTVTLKESEAALLMRALNRQCDATVYTAFWANNEQVGKHLWNALVNAGVKEAVR